MSTRSEFMERDARPARQPAKSLGRSSSQNPVVVLAGWRKGMNKVGVTRCLRQAGASLGASFHATNQVLQGQRVSVLLGKSADSQAVKRRLAKLGIIVG